MEAPRRRLPAQARRLGIEHVQFTFHHVLLEDIYFTSRRWSCYYKMKFVRYEACFWPHCKTVLSGAELLWSSKGHALIHRAIQQQLPNRGAVVFLTVADQLLFICQIQLTCPALQPFGEKEQTQLAYAIVTPKVSSSELSPWRRQTAGKDTQYLSRRQMEAVCAVSSTRRLCFCDT